MVSTQLKASYLVFDFSGNELFKRLPGTIAFV